VICDTHADLIRDTFAAANCIVNLLYSNTISFGDADEFYHEIRVDVVYNCSYNIFSNVSCETSSLAISLLARVTLTVNIHSHHHSSASILTHPLFILMYPFLRVSTFSEVVVCYFDINREL